MSFNQIRHSILFPIVALAGIILFLGSVIILFYMERITAKKYSYLVEGSGSVVSVSVDTQDQKNDGKLVHVTGPVETQDILTDPEFNISVRAVKLIRTVMMYQWKETKQSKYKRTGPKVYTYTYDKVWSKKLIKSKGFKHSEDHKNPSSIPFKSKFFQAKNVSFGAFTFLKPMISIYKDLKNLPVGSGDKLLPATMQKKGQGFNGEFYFGLKPSFPAIGDVRVIFKVALPGDVSIIAKQAKFGSGKTLIPYNTKQGGVINIFKHGRHSADEMFKNNQDFALNTMWFLRAFLIFPMIFGIWLIAKTLGVADLVPFFDDFEEFANWMAALLLALTVSALTVGIVWILYRPLFGGLFLAGSLVLMMITKSVVE